MDTNIKFCEIWIKSIVYNSVSYVNLLDFFYNIVFFYILRIELEISSLIQLFFFFKSLS